MSLPGESVCTAEPVLKPEFVGLLRPRELEAAKLAVASFDNQQISELMGVSISTTKFNLHEVYDKLNVTSRLELPFAFDPDESILDGIDLKDLSDKERDIFQKKTYGYTLGQIAYFIGKSISTLRTHTSNISRKFNLKDNVELSCVANAWKAKTTSAAIAVQSEVVDALAHVQETDHEPYETGADITKMIAAMLTRKEASISDLLLDPQTSETVQEIIEQEVAYMLRGKAGNPTS